jgi:hypothetical protein
MKQSKMMMLAIMLLSATLVLLPSAHAKGFSVYATVESVDATGNTLTTKYGKTVTTYKINKFTRVTLNGKDVKITDIVGGMSVSVTAAGGNAASRIDATDASAKK